MPLFFLIGGCLLAYRREIFVFPKTLTKKAIRLLVPGFFFSLLSILMFCLVYFLGGDDWMTYLIQNLVALLNLRFQGGMWFLPCYFFAEIIFLLLMRKTYFKFQTFFIGIISFAVAVYTSALSIRISRLLMALCFITIGYWFYQALDVAMGERPVNDKQKPVFNKRLLFAFLGVFLLVLGAIGSFFNDQVGCIVASYGENPLLFLFDGIAGTVD